MVDTGHFSPKQISACDGTTVWALGWIRSGPDLDREARDESGDILREYRLSDGTMVRSTLKRSMFPPTSRPAFSGHDFPDVTMRCSGKLLGIYEGASDEWIEYNLDTDTLSRWKLAKADHAWADQDTEGNILPKPDIRTSVTGVAMLDNGEVYASFLRHSWSGKAGSTLGLYHLKKSGNHANWDPIESTLAPANQQGAFDRLNGTDGVHLVYSRVEERGWFFSAPPQ
jgi:hypothetical protein